MWEKDGVVGAVDVLVIFVTVVAAVVGVIVIL